MDEKKYLWSPNLEIISSSSLVEFLKWINLKYNTQFTNYNQLHEWSIANIANFWEAIYQYFAVIDHGQYTHILQHQMPDSVWFEGSMVNYAEHIFRKAVDYRDAIIFTNEQQEKTTISWESLRKQVASCAQFLKRQGVNKGDAVVAYLPNIPEAIIAFLATSSLGAIWSSCSPDFGVNSVIDRFGQIKPKVMFVANGYSYNGKVFSRQDENQKIADQLPSLSQVVEINYMPTLPASSDLGWATMLANNHSDTLTFEAVGFNDPLWVLYSSGTTGLPKAITHSHGGCLLEHLKYLHLHNDVQEGEVFFWYSTTGWMMWNFSVASLLAGATLFLYEGSTNYPNLNILWQLADQYKITHFGTSAPFLVACMKQDLNIKASFGLQHLRSIGSTGAPLPPEAFEYVYDKIKENVWLTSMAGGTDVCTAFVGGDVTRPVIAGEIQCICLGCDLVTIGDEGKETIDALGEMIIKQAMPSMPIYFWNDEGKAKYRASYFETIPNVWRHGDWVKVTPEKSVIIYGRSDATLNRHGVRIGTAEIYNAVNKITEVEDSLIVNLELEGGKHYMPLFVKMKSGITLDQNVIDKIKVQLKSDYSPRHVPDEIIEVEEIPYTISGKKLEAPVKKILLGFDASKNVNVETIRNPNALIFFKEYRKVVMNK